MRIDNFLELAQQIHCGWVHPWNNLRRCHEGYARCRIDDVPKTGPSTPCANRQCQFEGVFARYSQKADPAFLLPGQSLVAKANPVLQLTVSL